MSRWQVALLLISVALPSSLTTAAAAEDVVATKQPRFRIPYHSDPAELQRLDAREIQLFVSTDRGQNWRLTQSVAPTAGRFAYEAPADGEYWFAVRTLDGSNRLHPQTPGMTPGLKVLVDTRAPDLTVSLERAGSQVRLTWRATDASLEPSSLKLEFRQPGFDDWQPVNVVAQDAGQTSWTAPSTGLVVVRGTIADRAGNVGSGNTELRIGEAGYAPLPANPDLEGPIAERYPADESLSTPFRMAADPGQGVPGRFASDAGQIPEIKARPPVEAAAGAPEEAASRKIVNTKAFNLGYQVDEVGPSGVGAVDFFITEDDGQKWFRYGSDPDLKSPVRIDVPREGTYGFQVRAKSGVGLAPEPPRPGEKPAVTVVVDQTPPVATLKPPAQTAGKQSPVVQFRWAVEDANPLKAKAIGLEYAASSNGPWTPIASELDDTGAYDWETTSIPAAKLFVRLVAKDAAGNIGHAMTAEPVVVDLTRPTARITEVDVEPIK
ncbi:MAG: hypothetical protein H0T47_09880 [Planctomycetaceae bacterium]|nr:hypothetical protein [Planctomycetaceae bacterium]